MTYELGKSLQEIVKNEEYVQTFFAMKLSKLISIC